MKRQSVAVEGSPQTGQLRVELTRMPGPGVFRLAQLHDDKANQLASVYRGCVRLGPMAVPAAIKLQRPVALTGEERSLVSAKLDGEWALHGLLRRMETAESS